MDDSAAPVPAPSVVLVCRANLCRSPMAEHLLRARPQVAGWSIGSAGILARAGQPMHPLAQAVLHEADVHIDAAWSSRPVDRAVVGSSDLILTASAAHATHVIERHPSALRRTFVLGNLARLLAGAEPGATATDPAGLLELAVAARRRVAPEAPGADDLTDPIGGGIADFRACAARIEQLLDVIVHRLAPPEG